MSIRKSLSWCALICSWVILSKCVPTHDVFVVNASQESIQVEITSEGTRISHAEIQPDSVGKLEGTIAGDETSTSTYNFAFRTKGGQVLIPKVLSYGII